MPGLTNETAVLFSNLEYILPTVDETAATFSFDETSALEQTVITITIAERSTVNAFWLDFSNVTQNTTLRVYKAIDGSNYRVFQENIWTTVDDDGVLIAGFVANENIRLTVQCGGGGVGSVDIPYTVL